MTDNADGNASCGGYEPNGDNSTTFRIYKVADGCGIQGGWNHAFNAVAFPGRPLLAERRQDGHERHDLRQEHFIV